MKRHLAALFVFAVAPQLMAVGTNDYEMVLKVGANADRVELGKRFHSGDGAVQDYSRAARLFYAAAADGDAEAQYWISRMYSDGTGLTPRPDKAFAWALASSDRGNAEGQNLLGVYYSEGVGTATNLPKAVEAFTKAARNGSAKAQFNLGASYEFGTGVARDFTQALDWYKRAARQDLAVAQYSLGTCYEFGRGTPVDYEAAVQWYALAAKQGDVRGQLAMGNCFEFGRGVGVDAGIAAAWYKEAANQGSAAGLMKLAECHDRGFGVAKSAEIATGLYAKAAEGGDAEAQFLYAARLEAGTGAARDLGKAAEWYAKAAGQGHERAASRVAYINRDDAAIDARSEAAKGSALVFKGLYLGMPIADAAALLERRLGEAGRAKALFVTARPEGGKQVADGAAIEMLADESGSVYSIYLANDIVDSLFASRSLSNKDFISGFLKAYGMQDLQPADNTVPIVAASGRQAGTQRQFAYRHASGSEVVFYDSYIVYAAQDVADFMKLGLFKPIGSMSVKRIEESDGGARFD